MLRHPTRNALTNAQFQAVQNLLMGILRCAENQLLTGKYVDETGITFDQFHCEIQHAVERLVKSIGRGNLTDRVVQNLNMRIIEMSRRGHEITLVGRRHSVQLQFFMARINVFWSGN